MGWLSSANPLCAGVGSKAHLDSRHQRGVIVGTVMPPSVDKESRGAIHAAAYAADEIAAHLTSVLARLKSIPHRCFEKPKLSADQENRRYAQPALVRKEGVVHIPEQPGCAGELSAFGGDLGERMYFGQREMTENEPHTSLKMHLHLVDDGMCRRAMRTLVIAVFNKSNRRVCRSADVIISRDRCFQGGHERVPELRVFRGRQEVRLRRDCAGAGAE